MISWMKNPVLPEIPAGVADQQRRQSKQAIHFHRYPESVSEARPAAFSSRSSTSRERAVILAVMSLPEFSHLDASGAARMVDVGPKPEQRRFACAEGFVRCRAETIAALREKALPKGDVLTVAKIAGIQAAKRTDALIPLCHSLPLDAVEIFFEIESSAVRIVAEVSTTAKTGVEMEALTAVSVAALTIYDMCKAVDKGMVIADIRVTKKVKA